MKLFLTIFLFFPLISYSQTITTVSKKCGKCDMPVSVNSKIGDRCPYCGVVWGQERSSISESYRKWSYDPTYEFVYFVRSRRAYFYSTASYTKRKKAYLIYGDIVYPLREVNGFVYIDFVNDRGQRTIGWISKDDLK